MSIFFYFWRKWSENETEARDREEKDRNMKGEIKRREMIIMKEKEKTREGDSESNNILGDLFT